MSSKSAWSRIAEHMQDPATREAQRERLAAAVGPEATQTALEQELRREMAQALGRAEARLRAAIAAVEAAEAALAPEPGAEALAAFDALRTAALDARLDFVIQREAIGIRRNDRIEQLYPIPRRRR